MVWTDSEKIALPIALLIVFIITIIVYLLTKNKSNKIKKLPLFIVSSIMLCLEVVKQILAISDYSYWSIPLHFCSFFLFWTLLATFSKNDNWSKMGYNMSVVFGILFLLLFYINPSTIIGSSSENILQSFSSFHTFVYHHLMILFVFLTFSQSQFKPKTNHAIRIFVLYTSYAVLAIAFAHLLQVNFTNLLSSNIPFMQAVLDNFGIVVYTTIMYFVGLVGCLGAFGASYSVYKSVNKSKQRKQKIKNKFA